LPILTKKQQLDKVGLSIKGYMLDISGSYLGFKGKKRLKFS